MTTYIKTKQETTKQNEKGRYKGETTRINRKEWDITSKNDTASDKQRDRTKKEEPNNKKRNLARQSETERK